ncbi:hypothetical protein, partial [Aeromonas sp. QDB54]|uniref:hypothetical protein n=1 Tax=Aeromonas sp. QDB54 TaxID=2989826 RepID=UPI0022E597AE
SSENSAGGIRVFCQNQEVFFRVSLAYVFLRILRGPQLRVFRKLDTLQAYLQEIGVVRFEIDAAGFVVAPRQR